MKLISGVTLKNAKTGQIKNYFPKGKERTNKGLAQYAAVDYIQSTTDNEPGWKVEGMSYSHQSK